MPQGVPSPTGCSASPSMSAAGAVGTRNLFLLFVSPASKRVGVSKHSSLLQHSGLGRLPCGEPEHKENPSQKSIRSSNAIGLRKGKKTKQSHLCFWGTGLQVLELSYRNPQIHKAFHVAASGQGKRCLRLQSGPGGSPGTPHAAQFFGRVWIGAVCQCY